MGFVAELRTIRNFIREFGLLDCIDAIRKGLFFQDTKLSRQLLARGGGIVSLRLDKLKFPLFIRPGDSDWMVFNKVFLEKEYKEPSEAHATQLQAAYARVVARGKRPIIIDCGANVGFASIWFARHFPKAVIFAVEPQSDNFMLLKKNTESYPNIKCINAGISDVPGRIELADGAHKSWAFHFVESSGGQVVLTTMYELFAEVGDDAVLIVKIDIEGFEKQLFRSNTEWMGDVPLIVAETHDWLFPWHGSAHALYSKFEIEDVRDAIRNGENDFFYSHRLLKPPVCLELDKQ